MQKISQALNIAHLTDHVVIRWIVAVRKSENRDSIDFIIKALTDHWEYKEMVDQLITGIVTFNKDVLGLKLYVVEDTVEKALKILKNDPISNMRYEFEVQNVSLEMIHDLPLDDNTFFGPSFRFLSDRKEPEIDSEGF